MAQALRRHCCCSPTCARSWSSKTSIHFIRNALANSPFETDPDPSSSKYWNARRSPAGPADSVPTAAGPQHDPIENSYSTRSEDCCKNEKNEKTERDKKDKTDEKDVKDRRDGRDSKDQKDQKNQKNVHAPPSIFCWILS